MFKFLLNLFLGRSVSGLTKKSDRIFNVFTQTQKDCEALNAEINKVVISKEEAISKLQEEVNSLNAVKTKNSNLSAKISSFLSS